MGASVIAKVASGAVLHATDDGLISVISQRSGVTFVKGTGFMVLDTKVKIHKAGATDPVIAPAQIEMGCLGDNYLLRYTPKVDEMPLRCGDGDYALPKGGTWRLSVEDIQLSPYLFAAETGLMVQDASIATNGIRLFETETLTVATLALPALTNDAVIIRSVKRLDTNEYLHEVDALTTVADEFKYTVATKIITFAAASDLNGVKVEVEYLYDSSTDGDGVVLVEGGLPQVFGAHLSFLAIDDDNQARGKILVQINKMRNTAEVQIGAANQEITKFNRDYLIDGVPTFHWQEFEA